MQSIWDSVVKAGPLQEIYKDINYISLSMYCICSRFFFHHVVLVVYFLSTKKITWQWNVPIHYGNENLEGKMCINLKQILKAIVVMQK